MMKRGLRLVFAGAALAAACHAGTAAARDERRVPPGIAAFQVFGTPQEYVVYVDECGNLDLLASGAPGAFWTHTRLFASGVYAPHSPLLGYYDADQRVGHVLFLAGEGQRYAGDLYDAYGNPPTAIADVTATTGSEPPGTTLLRSRYHACGRTLSGVALRDDIAGVHEAPSPWQHEPTYAHVLYTGRSGVLHDAEALPDSLGWRVREARGRPAVVSDAAWLGPAPRFDVRSPTLRVPLPTVPADAAVFYVGTDRRVYVRLDGVVSLVSQPGQTLPAEPDPGGANVLAGYYDLLDASVHAFYVGDDGFVYEYRRALGTPSWTWEAIGGGGAAAH